MAISDESFNIAKPNYVNVFLGLGSNLDNPVQQIKTAITSLQHLPESELLSVSSLYQSRPLTIETAVTLEVKGQTQQQPDYINAVANIKTRLTAFELLDATMQIEQQQKRVREERWGPRTLDIDLLLYGAKHINTESLTVPHPGMHQRSFVLLPLSELVSEGFEIPGRGSLQKLLLKSGEDDIKRLDS